MKFDGRIIPEAKPAGVNLGLMRLLVIILVSILKKTARYFAQKKYCREAIAEHADLGAFKEKLTTPIAVGLSLIAFSFVIGMPAVVTLGIIAVWLKKPLIGIIGGPLIYGLSTLFFIIGLKLAGKKYVAALGRWLARIVLEKILGDEAKELPPCARANKDIEKSIIK